MGTQISTRWDLGVGERGHPPLYGPGQSTRGRILPSVLLLSIVLLTLSSAWLDSSGLTPAVRALPTPKQLGSALVSPPLRITAFTPTPSTVLILGLLNISLNATGGAPPYTYWYRDLPPGCRSQNESSITCYPSSAQHYEIEGTVNDTTGAQVNATANLTIKNGFGKAPAIQSFYAWPAPGAVGKITYLVVSAVSQDGTPTSVLSYAFIDLPPGCGTFNQTNLSCIPNEPGVYKIWARVTDSYAQFNQTFLFLNVTGNASNPTQPSSGGLSAVTKEYIVAGVGLLVAVVVVVLVLEFLRKPPSKPSVEPTPTTPPAGPPRPGG